MEGRKTKKVKAAKTATSKRQPVVSVEKKSVPKKTAQKKPATKISSKKPIKKPAAKKTSRRASRTTAPVVDSITQLPPSRVSGLVQPLKVQMTAAPMLQASGYVHPWSIRHNLVIILSLTITAVIAMTLIAGFTQTTLQQIESLEASSATLMKPTATATRFFTTPAGEAALTLPITWAVTDSTENRITYTHTTLPNTTLTIQVETNDTDNVFTWLQVHEPNYTNATVIASTAVISALRGVTVSATSSYGLPMTVVYVPIQKNLGERYIVSIQAVVPDGSSIAVQEALEDITANLEVK